MEMLTVSHIYKAFGKKKVLSDLSFSVPEGSVFGFVGQNGAGKTTTMKTILGLIAADSGEICINGESVSYGQNTTNRYVGFLPDVPEFYSYMTPKEYLDFCGEITGMETKKIKSRTVELLTLVGLENENRHIKGFSRGMKQRLGIAQALLNQPKLLICDEPTSALDPIGRKEILDILVSSKEQTTVLFSTHILSDVERICTEVAFINDGKIAISGTLEKIRNMHPAAGFEIELEHSEDADKLLSVFSGGKKLTERHLTFNESDELKMIEVLGFIVEQKLSLKKVERLETTLESLFLEVVGE
ncbi:ABC transporter ATP-binding protein [Anaerosacchariphilus polymeriproducens]|uniref:ABC transporter ATP-binding protein n=1 Tax=Anaerosacchariphilus polymeriproducens TaxID=1812858 RepID=A0A371AVU7_9FIRM|nr:ABC transporter ATP-binding protein [Anaerosacchariphilus polymeriproducens]RDU23661.1 ABC transporter ATP-binding protein [Anaerosacchariphilus polymeriproducens]